MSEPRDSEFLGPLPKSDRNSELEQLSIDAFKSLLPVDKFVFRDERINDAGVDGSLELKISSRYTNLRAQVQLKSTDSNDTNEDGSISVQVTVANLNYLLNGPSPIYVLFVFPRKELRFVWVRDERKRLDEVNPDWMQQNNITVRFQSFLNEENIEQIHERIQKEAQLQREITDILGRASNTESVVVSINPETLNITDPDKAKQILLSSGTLIVSAGYSNQVRNLARLLDLETAQLPRIMLVRAYAEYTLGRFQIAYALLSEAMLCRHELSEDDQQFLDFLRDGCDHQAGRITIHELAARLEQKEQSQTDGFALSYRIEQLRYKVLLNRDPISQRATVDELRSLVTEIIKDTSTSEVFKVSARSALLEAEGVSITGVASWETGEARLKLQVGPIPDILGMARKHLEQFNVWQGEMVRLINDAFRVGHPNLIAQTILQRATTYFQFLMVQRSFSQYFNLPIPIPEEGVQKILEEAGKASRIYAQANQLEGELRAEMVKADYLELIGQDAEAQKIAMNVLPKAQAMNYAIIILRAEEHLLGQGFRHKQDLVMKKKTEKEQAIRNANRTDEESRRYAEQALRAMELPAERLPVLEREYFSIRDVARDKISWCKYIDRLNDERHTWHPSTKYRTDPNRICICNLHGFRSQTPNPDWQIISADFKKIYCEGCKDRNPIQN
jgi:hypothetical protein